MEPIDFVILWVDGADPEWQKERERYLSSKHSSAAEKMTDNGNDENRFRDWDLLRYWFRGIERFAPWVRNIFFVTWGHYPAWLNLEHPKLKLIRHEDYIPKEKLPVFNSNVIELYLNRIPELSERFVLFNDDMFLMKPVKETDFFHGKLPCESALMDAPSPENIRNVFPHMMLNNAAVINQHFDKKQVLRTNWKKFFTLKYKKGLLRNLLLAPLEWFSCFRSEHVPIAHLKSTFDTVWREEEAVLSATGSNRFRSREDVTHWLMKDWRICEGQFVPRSTDWSHCFELGKDDLNTICRCIEHPVCKAICLNDSRDDIAFEYTQAMLQKSFEKLLPKISAYEREIR
ncbi:MAG: Stealth CR1 domain-containing protein [Lachnospiraceae bacterium]|nr:Stealth CR1 domain-containing protein [Lachnospiraceae bacterium]